MWRLFVEFLFHTNFPIILVFYQYPHAPIDPIIANVGNMQAFWGLAPKHQPYFN